MGKVVVMNHLTLDGVMQAPGRPDEDTRGGLGHGGWAIPGNDEVMGRVMAEQMAHGRPLLLGRWTYESFYDYWPHQGDNPFTTALDQVRKYVASRRLSEPLPWSNSTLLAGDATSSVAELREAEGPDIVVMGSGDLVRSLAALALIDRYVLMIHPIVLGAGRRLFPGGTWPLQLRVLDSVTTSTGVTINSYVPVTG